MDQLETLSFTATFPTISRVICRLTVRFPAARGCGHHELALRARRLLAEAALGRGGDSVVDFRIDRPRFDGRRRGGGTWWVATGVLAVTTGRAAVRPGP